MQIQRSAHGSMDERREFQKDKGNKGNLVLESFSSRAMAIKVVMSGGNVQRVVRMALDCDLDTLPVEVIPNGPACHTGATSCFFNEIPLEK